MNLGEWDFFKNNNRPEPSIYFAPITAGGISNEQSYDIRAYFNFCQDYFMGRSYEGQPKQMFLFFDIIWDEWKGFFKPDKMMKYSTRYKSLRLSIDLDIQWALNITPFEARKSILEKTLSRIQQLRDSNKIKRFDFDSFSTDLKDCMLKWNPQTSI